jgi:hypothetical protein
VIAAACAALVLAVHPAAQAHRLPNQWCPKRSRYCLDVQKQNGHRFLSMFRDGKGPLRFHLCITAPDGSRACRHFRIYEGLGSYSNGWVWREHFPDKGPGPYRVAWHTLEGERIGPVLGFMSRQ